MPNRIERIAYLEWGQGLIAIVRFDRVADHMPLQIRVRLHHVTGQSTGLAQIETIRARCVGEGNKRTTGRIHGVGITEERTV